MATITETLRLVFAADEEKFQKGIGATLAQLEILRGSLLDMTAPIINLQEEMLSMASGFESSIANVNTLLGDEPELIQRFKDEIVALSTEIPQSAQEISDALYQAISAGVSTGEAMNFIAAAGKAATAGMTSTFVAVDGGTSVLNAFNLEATESNRVFDLMFQAVRDGKITFEQMSTQMGMLAPTAAAAGVNIEQMFGVIATATGKLRPEQAFTGLAGAITELNTPSSKAEKALKRLGYENLQTALKTETLQDIFIKLVNSGEKIDAVFGREASRAVNAVGQSADKARLQLEHMNNAAGATQTAFEKVNATFENSQKHLQNVRDAVKIQIGQEMMPTLTKWNNLQASILANVQELPGSFKAAAGAGMLLAKGLSGAVNTGGSLVRNLTALHQGARVAQGTFKLFQGGIDTLRLKFWDLQDSMKNADGSATNLAKGLGAAGLGAAIAFTTGQLIKLYGAILDYNKAMDSMEQQQKAYLDWSEKLTKSAKSEDEVLKNNLPTLYQYRDALDENSTAWKRLKKLGGKGAFGILDSILAPNEAKMLREQLNAIGIDAEKLSKEQLDALITRGEAYKNLVEETNKAKEAEIEAAEGIKALTPEEQLDTLIRKLAAYGVEFEKTGDAAKDLARAEKMLRKEEAKAAEERKKEQIKRLEEIEKLKEKNLDTEQKAFLKAQENTEAYYTTLEEIEVKRFKKEEEQQQKTLGNLKAKYGEQSAEVKAQLAIIEELEMAHYLALDSIDIEHWEFLDKKRLSDEEKRKEAREKELQETIALYGGMTDAAMGFFTALGEAAVGGDAVGAMKAQLKALLQEALNYLEIKYILGKGVSLIEGIFNGASLIKNIPTLIAAEGALGLARGMVASFDTSGIPRTAGMAYVEPDDVILNPSSGEMGVLNALADQIASQINQRPLEARLYLDGREVAKNTIKHTKQMNETLPKGRSVFD